MPLGNPVPPQDPVPSPTGRARRIPSQRSAGTLPNLVEGFYRYLRYREILKQRARRKIQEPPTPEAKDPHEFDTRV